MSDELEAVGLTAEERHMISRVRNEAGSGLVMFELAYLVPSLVLFALALIHRSPAAFVCGLGIVVTFRVWYARQQARSTVVLRNAVEKLCDALRRRAA